MASLLKEAGIKAREDVGKKTAQLGGSLLDELALVNNEPEKLSKRFTDQQIPPGDARNKALDDLNNSMNAFQKFAVGAGRGLTNLARGVGLAEQEDDVTREAANRLTNDSAAAQVGQIVGEASPFLAAAPLAGAGLTTRAGATILPAAKTLGTKVLGATGLGVAEGSIITRGGGGDATDTAVGGVVGGTIAGVIETVFPVLGRMGNALFKSLGRKPKGPLLTPEGGPTPEFQTALEETGTSFENLTREAITEVNAPGVNPEQAARSARFASEEIPATRGDVTQDFAQQAEEQRIIASATSEAGEPLRQLKLEQSEALKGKVNELYSS